MMQVGWGEAAMEVWCGVEGGRRPLEYGCEGGSGAITEIFDARGKYVLKAEIVSEN